MKKRILRLTAAGTAALLLTLSAFSVYAETGQRIKTLVGDVSGDMHIAQNDVRILWDALLTANRMSKHAQMTLEQTDLDGNGAVNAADLTLLKRMILTRTPPKVIYETFEKIPVEPPIRALQPSMPSTGKDRILMFAVSFPDCAFETDDIAAQMQARCFGAAAPDDPAYPMESISAYYARASYGRLQLTGDVFAYTAAHPLGWYAEQDADALPDEIMSAMDAQLDYRAYDADKNGILDAMIVALPDDAAKIDENGDKVPDWWPYTTAYSGFAEYDGITAGAYCIGACGFGTPAGFNNKWIHELGHAMGLPDYYKYVETDKDGLNGSAGDEIMDEGTGDFSAFSKLMLGWLTEDEIQVYTGGTQTFRLTSMQQTPSCVIIPRTPDAGMCSEFFLLEYTTFEANNSARCVNGEMMPAVSKSGGVRVLHCQAEISEGRHGMEFTYHNYGAHYDRSNQKQRVLRLVNEYEGGYFFPFNKINKVDDKISGFRWYDEAGDLTVETGFAVSVGKMSAGPLYIPEPQDPMASFISTPDAPEYFEGSWHSITICPAQS